MSTRCHSCGSQMHMHCANGDCMNQCDVALEASRAWGAANRMRTELRTLVTRIEKTRVTGNLQWLYDYTEQVKGRIDA